MKQYKSILNEMFFSIVKAVGIHASLLIVEHSLWKITQKYEEASCIIFDEAGIVLEGLSPLDNEKAQLISKELMISMVDTLSRLVGEQIAHQLMQTIEEV